MSSGFFTGRNKDTIVKNLNDRVVAARKANKKENKNEFIDLLESELVEIFGMEDAYIESGDGRVEFMQAYHRLRGEVNAQAVDTLKGWRLRCPGANGMARIYYDIQQRDMVLLDLIGELGEKRSRAVLFERMSKSKHTPIEAKQFYIDVIRTYENATERSMLEFEVFGSDTDEIRREYIDYAKETIRVLRDNRTSLERGKYAE